MSDLDPEQIEAIFADLAELPREERETSVENACGGDEELCAEIRSLLEAYDSAAEHFDDLRGVLPMQSLSDAVDDGDRIDPYEMVGRTISHFRVEEFLGGGAMGVVYRARDVLIPTFEVALKILAPEMSRSENAVARFKYEAIAASLLEHVNIAVVHEVGRMSDGQLFVAMSFYDGETLKKKVGRGPMPIQSVVDYGRGVAAGLAEAHRHGIIHRDVKPANVMVTRAGHVKLLDFGVAKVSDVSALTSTGSVVGTLAYMSPEQVRGENVDARTDIWSLGLMLYEMLTGVHPFMAEHQQAIIYQILNLDPPDIALHRQDAPDELVRLVKQCLSKDLSERPASMDEIEQRLSPAPAPEMIEPLPPPGLLDVFRSWWARHPAVFSAVAGAVAILVGILLLLRPAHLDIAVLPFANVNADSAFVGGLMYSVSSSLARIEGMDEDVSVVPASDILTDNVRSSRDAARLFNVDWVMGGSVQRESASFAISLDLVNAATGRISQSRFFRIADSEIDRAQDEVFEAITDLLSLHFDSAERERLQAGETEVSGAYDRYTRARGYLLMREEEVNVDAAINLLLASVQEDEQFVLAHAALGEAYMQKYRLSGDTSYVAEAVAHAMTARRLNPDLASVRIVLGQTLMERGDYPAAELEFLRANALEPNSATARFELAKANYRLDRIENAERFFREARDLKPDYWVYHNELGKFYFYQRRFQSAAASFERVVQLRPENPWGYINLGAQYQELGERDRAFNFYTLATEVNPDMPGAIAFAYNNIARLYYSERDFEQAAGWFEDAVELEDLDYDSWDQLGNSYHMTGRSADARTAWRRSVELAASRTDVNPNDRDALNSLAELYAKLGAVDLATTALSRLMSQDRLESNDFVVAAKVHEILGRRDSALHYVEEAFEHGATKEDIERSVWLDGLRGDRQYLRLRAGDAVAGE